MTSTHEGYLRALTTLPKAARKAYLFADMQASLLSIGQLCDAGCIALFNKKQVLIIKDNSILLEGQRDGTTGLWNVAVPTNQPVRAPGPNVLQHAALSAIAAETVGERMAFLHACAGSPAISTFRAAISAGYFTTWPELTVAHVDKYLVEPAATVQGHLDQQRRNLRSTKPAASRKSLQPHRFPGLDENATDSNPVLLEARCNLVTLSCMPITGQIYSDQPGQFLVASISGMKYMMVAHCYDSNAILAVPMTSRTGAALLGAYKEIHALLTSRGFQPRYQRLDNEASTALKDFMTAEGVDYQLTPAGTHRRNNAERAIRTWKNHFIAIL